MRSSVVQPNLALAPSTGRLSDWRTRPRTPLHRLLPGDLLRFMLKQPISFWLVCLYMFFEYVRPQALYPPLHGLPLPLWTIVLACATFVFEGNRFRRLNLLDGLLIVFTLVVVASCFTAYDPAWSFSQLTSTWLSWVIIYFLITNSVTTEKKFIVFMLLYFVWCLKMSQFGSRMVVMRGFSFSSWGLTCAPQFFHNSGECGIQLVMYFTTSLYFLLGVLAFVSKRTKWVVAIMPITAGIAVMGSSSRGAQLALAAVLIWMVLRSRRPFRSLIIAGVSAAMFYAIMPQEQKDRFSTMGTDETSMARRQYWRDGIKIMNSYPVLGVGFDNWLPFYMMVYKGYPQLPHNIFIEAGAELGYTGLASFIALIIATFWANRRTRRLASKVPRGHFLHCMAHGLDGALIGYLVGGYFVTVLYYPFFWINLAMTTMLFNITSRAAAQAGALTAAQAARQPGAPARLRAQHAT